MCLFVPRYKLIAARERADLSQEELAEEIHADAKTVSAWETGAQHPQPGLRRRVREALGNNQDRHLFTNYPEEEIPQDDDAISSVADKCEQLETKQPLSAPCREESNHAMLESSDSHTFIIYIPGSDKELSMDKLRREINKVVGTTL